MRRYQEIVEFFTKIILRTINQKHEVNFEQKDQDQIIDTQSKDNKDIKEIENSAQNQDDQAQEQPAANECPYFGSRILNEISMQYSFKYLWEQAKHNVPEPVWPDPDKELLSPQAIQ